MAQSTQPGAKVYMIQHLTEGNPKLRLQMRRYVYATSSADAIYLCNLADNITSKTEYN